ncbi:MAG: hypothetical protein CVU01_03710 [Bacteroidetes bacterium HGW-Bacteroidetes-18]|nr:MAG: hypothetical protein CVU01_03710 [Bacteroidetes bacterium HGW-Bacteroidetes-18]
MVLADVQTVSGLKTFLYDKLGMRNAANTFTSFFRNANTAIRYYTLPNRDGTLLDNTDYTTLNNAINTKLTNPVGGVANYLSKFLTATTIGLSRLWDTGTFLGIGTVNSPLKDITLGNQANREIGVELSNSSTVGRDLIISAGKTINYLLNTDLNQVTDVLNGWVGMTAAPNNDIYVTTRIGTIYIQTNSEGAFLTFGQATRQWRGMTAAPNGDIYAVTLNGDIYKRTAGAGDFLALGQTSRSWHDIAAAANGDIYATVRGGDIYKQTNGTGDFIGIGELSRQWRGITVAPNGDIYATVSGGDIYKQVGGVGAFSGLGQTTTIWNFIQAAPNGNIYASRSADSQTEDIYVQIGGLGNFQSIGQPSRRYHGLAVNSLGDLYAAEGGDTGYTGYIYKQINNAAGLADLDGGALIHKAGTGKGTGKSRYQIITGQKTASGTDMQLETLRIEVDEDGNYKRIGTPVYADNAAALAGGLTAGMEYRTATGVKMEVY